MVFHRKCTKISAAKRAGTSPLLDCRKTFFDFMQHLRPIEWFVGNGLDRSVPPCQKHNVTRKPRAIRRDFMRCARPDVRMGHCARRRVSERNRRAAAALGAEIDPSLQISRKRTFFYKLIACTSPLSVFQSRCARTSASHAAGQASAARAARVRHSPRRASGLGRVHSAASTNTGASTAGMSMLNTACTA